MSAAARKQPCESRLQSPRDNFSFCVRTRFFTLTQDVQSCRNRRCINAEPLRA